MKNYDKAKSDFENLIRNDKFPYIANLYMGNFAIIDKQKELAIKFRLQTDKKKTKSQK